MNRHLRLAGLSLSCLTVLNVGMAQFTARASELSQREASAIAATALQPERPRLTRPVEPKRNFCPRSVRLVDADPSSCRR